jgi:hypothetical protein
LLHHHPFGAVKIPSCPSLSFVRYRYQVMKTFLASLLTLVMLSAHAYGAVSSSSLLPTIPTPAAVKSPVFAIADWSLAGSVVLTRALDWTSTEECLRRPWQQCHEAELPTALVKNKVEFAAYEAGVSGLSILAEYEMAKHGHKRLARLGQSIDLAVLGDTVAHNYRLDLRPVNPKH